MQWKMALDRMRPGSGSDEAAASVAAVSALDEPTRRRLYDLIRAAQEPVSRDDAAAELGIPRKTAAFHLDKLAEAGLLDVSFARRNGRTGPGAGRPAKLYARARRDFSVHLPERSYELAGELMARAIDDSARTGDSPVASLARHAADYGREIGASTGPTEAELLAALEHCGYEPRTEDGRIVLANCPFHSLVEQHTELVCHMNLDLIGGMIDATGCSTCHAQLRPRQGYCCVAISSEE